MHFNNLFTIFTIMILIIVVLIADSFVTAVALCMLLINILALSIHHSVVDIDYSTVIPTIKLSKSDSITKDSTADTKVDLNKESTMSTDSIEPAVNTHPQTPHMYGPEYDVWQTNQTSYSDCYNEPQLPIAYSCSERSGVDAKLGLLAQQRARDRKCIDGAVAKNADYYKFHFADELAQSESKPWWGHADE